ncbi:MAG TPA: response regulator transcription factor [Pedococcus sp.]|nr:response regulator transcription factor [Pedococcus sp.]
MSQVRVLIADDHPQMLSALVSALETDGRFVVVATATTGREAVRLAGELSIDVALLDVRMPAGGPSAVAEMARLTPPPVIVAISADTHASTVAAIVSAGATGYLAKGRIGERLPEVVARCAQGEVILATTSGAEAMRWVLTGRSPRV